MKGEKVYIYGKHALQEALTHRPQVVKKVFLADGAADAALSKLIADAKLIPHPIKDQKGVAKDASHQGVIGLIDTDALVVEFNTFIEDVAITADTAVVLLDEIQDPHNVGAVIRSAAAFGACAVLLPQHNQAQVTGAVVKVSAGMAFRISVVSIGNVNQTLRILKDKGFWVYGLAAEGENEISTEKFDAPAVFIVGNEGEGIRQKTLELCDVKLSIAMHPRAESLNAAVSGAIVLHEWSKQHSAALL